MPPNRSTAWATARSASSRRRTSAADGQHLGERLAGAEVLGRPRQFRVVPGDQREPGAFVRQFAREDQAQSA